MEFRSSLFKSQKNMTLDMAQSCSYTLSCLFLWVNFKDASHVTSNLKTFPKRSCLLQYILWLSASIATNMFKTFSQIPSCQIKWLFLIIKQSFCRYCDLFFILICLSVRREEVHGEAQRVLRCLPGRNKKESASKQMPSFPEMVYYIQEKVWHSTSGN